MTRPLRRDAERNRQRILAAARGLVAERGLAVSHDEVARAADVGVGTVYRRFPDREALVEALFAERVEEVVGLARAARDAADPWDGLERLLVGVLELSAADLGLKDLIVGAGGGSRLAARAREAIAPVVAELVERAHAAGALRPGVTVTDVALVPLLVGAVIDAARPVAPELWRRALAQVLDGLRGDRPLPGVAAGPADLDRILGGAG